MSDGVYESVWVIGGGGLLGRAVAGEAKRRDQRLFSANPIPWGDRSAASDVLNEELSRFLAESAQGEWCVYWCAGAGVMATGDEDLEQERLTFASFVEGLRARLSPELAARGRFFLASSAAVYGGSASPPFSELTVPRPVSAYGRTKLAMESFIAALAAVTGIRVVAGRIANVYGPGQNLEKPQGLISQLLLARRSGIPLTLYADAGTLRDYIYVDDAASLIVDSVWRPTLEGEPGAVAVRVIATGTAVTISGVLDAYSEATGEQPLVHRQAPRADQIIDLRLQSLVEESPRERSLIPIVEGIRRTAAATMREGAHS